VEEGISDVIERVLSAKGLGLALEVDEERGLEGEVVY
jgi:hypothetical protein